MPRRPLPPHTKLHSKDSKLVFEGVRFSTYQWEQKQFDGSIATYETVKRNDTVIIIPVIGDEIVLVKEIQPHWDEPGYTLVAGMVNADEELEVAARRELEEETGLIFENFDLVHVDTIAPSVEWCAYTFVASGFKGEKEKQLDPGEKNETVKMTFEKLLEITRKKGLHYRPLYIEEKLMQGKEDELWDSLQNPQKYKI